MFGCLHNVQGDIIDVVYDEGLLGNKTVETPVAEGIYGFLSYVGLGKEGDANPNRERERSSAYRLHLTKSSCMSALEGQGMERLEEVVAGRYFRVQRKRMPRTNAWATLEDFDQYKIDFISDTFAISDERTLGLTLVPR